MADDPDFYVGVLGPLLVKRGGSAIRLRRGRAGVLLAVLALSAGYPVGAERLADLLWPDEQPLHVRDSLSTVASRLRTALPGVVRTVSDGYLLDIDPGRVDVLRFRQFVRAADLASGFAAVGHLEQALELWRGAPLADIRSAALDREVIPGLTDEYLSAVQRRAGLELAAGRGDRVTAELRGLTAQYPLREPLWDQLLRALADTGRPAEAIQEYHRVREVLAVELGVDPSPELQDTYRHLLQTEQRAGTGGPRSSVSDAHDAGADPSAGGAPGGKAAGPAALVPHRLPADTRVFTGRQTELARLLELADAGDGTGGTVAVSAVDGMAGIGKTALVVHAGHRLAGRFSDGQLFSDLRGYDRRYPPRTAEQVLGMFLRALGIAPQLIPADAGERAELYRQRLAGTRTLIVLDNAVDESQVRPLIPGTAGCMVLVTSRRKLKGLDDAHTIALDVLPEPDAIALFCAVAGPGRAAAGDQAVAALAGLCGQLPLALRIAAALLRNRPAWNPGRLARMLSTAQSRLDALADSDRDLAALFALSTEALSADQRRLYVLTGLAPGLVTDVYATAALLDTDLGGAERLLQELVDHNLLLEPAAGRYRMHDLVREHATTIARQIPVAERDSALGRLFGYYQHTALKAEALICGRSGPHPADRAPLHSPALRDSGAARRWLRTERAVLTACLGQAIGDGDDQRIVALAAGLASLLRTDGPWPQAIDVYTEAAAAAARLGDPSGQALALTERASLHRLIGDYPCANSDLQLALGLWQAADTAGRARALTELATVQRICGDPVSAIGSLRSALRLWRKSGHIAGQAFALTQLGMVRTITGEYVHAENCLRHALRLWRETGDAAGQALAVRELALIRMMTGDNADATSKAELVLAICEQLGDVHGQANALHLLGNIRQMTGDHDGAVRHQQAAIAKYRTLGDRTGQAIARTCLGEIQFLNGNHDEAARELAESVATFRDLGTRGNQAWALNRYAAAVSAAGDPARAISLYRDAMNLARAVRHPDDEAAALEGLGESQLRQGNFRDARAALRQALDIYRQLGLPAAAKLSARLADVESAGRPPA